MRRAIEYVGFALLWVIVTLCLAVAVVPKFLAGRSCGMVSAKVGPNSGHTPSSNFSSAIFFFQTCGASWWTLFPSLSTATVTGKSLTSNS